MDFRFTPEEEAYLPRYFNESKVAEIAFGDAKFNRKLLAERLGY